MKNFINEVITPYMLLFLGVVSLASIITSKFDFISIVERTGGTLSEMDLDKIDALTYTKGAAYAVIYFGSALFLNFMEKRNATNPHQHLPTFKIKCIILAVIIIFYTVISFK